MISSQKMSHPPHNLYAPIGPGGLLVSRVCLGTMTFGNPISGPECRTLVHAALDRGVNFFDTSNAYEGYDRSFGSAGGVGEELLGHSLEGRRHQAVICTKFANPIGGGPLDAGLSPRHLESELDKSLKRLRTDYVDIVLAHRWDAAATVEEVWRVFERWVSSGKVLMVGTSNWPVWRMAQAAGHARVSGGPALAVSSPRYNLLHRGIELEHIPCAAHYGIALLTYQPFQGGALIGRYRRSRPAPAGSRGSEMPDWLPSLDDVFYRRLEALEALAAESGMNLLQYVTSWTLSRRCVASMVVGCRTPAQLDEVVGGALRPFPVEQESKVDSLFPSPAPSSGEAVLSWGKDGWKLQDFESPLK